MNPEDFKNSTAGRCIRTIRQPAYWAYVPNPLPPKIEVDWELVRLLSRAESKLGELSGVGQLLPEVHRLIQPLLIRRESVTSSRIENTQSGLDDLFLFEADESRPSPMPDVREVINYVRAMEYGVKRLENLPISSRFICEIHGILLDGVRGDSATPGEMRKSQNWIGSPGGTLMDASYIPPPLPEMKECLSALEKYINFNAIEPALIQCALVHYQFEAIHPFLDGNGRLGRLLITFMLLEKKLLSQPLLYLSDFFEQYKDEYYRLLLNVSRKGDWKAWLTFFLNGVRQQSEDALATVQKLLDPQKQYREVATGQRVPKIVTGLIDHLFSGPIVSISRLSKAWKTPFPTVKRGVDYLVEEGILEEITNRQRNRLFVAHEIYYIIMAQRTKSMNPGETGKMNETVVGLSDLPDGWKVKTLGEVTDIFKGGTPRRNVERYFQGDIAWATPTDITKLDGALYIDDTTTHISEEALGKSTARLLPAGTVLLTSRATIGKVAIAKVPMATNQGFANFLCKGDIANVFLAHYLNSITDLLISLAGGTTFLEVTKTTLLNVEIPLPPLPEQHRIVAKIEELFTKLDAGINALHKVQAQLRRYRQSVLKAAFEGKLTEAWRMEHQDGIEPASVLLERILKERREKWEAEQIEQMKAKGKMPKDDKWKAKYKEPAAPDLSQLPELPRGWVQTTVGSIGVIASGQTPKGINDLDSKGETPFYKISDMNEPSNEKFMRTAEITLDDCEIERLGIHVRERGTVIFPKRGGAIATNKKRILTFPSAYDLNIMGVLPYNVPTDFFYQWLQSTDLAALSDGSNVPQLNHKDIDPLPFPLPPLPEQVVIVSEVDSRLSIADEVEKTVKIELKRAERLRQSIFKKAFSGKLVPQDPNDEPASALFERIKAEK